VLACPFAKFGVLLDWVFEFYKRERDHHGGEGAKYGECLEWHIDTATTEEAG
jgi:hypothetical protein